MTVFQCGLCGRDLTSDEELRWRCCDQCMTDELEARAQDAAR